jgi:hypothetical protein
MLATLNVVILASTVVLSPHNEVGTHFRAVLGPKLLAATVFSPQTATEVGTLFRSGAPGRAVRAGFWPITVEKRVPTSFRAPERSKAKRAMWAAIGGVGGFFGGAYLGAALEPDCNCDDPGFKGFLIGAPIGAATGAILGWVFGR